jgi:GNAT superfamily N-acetyltransferase
MPRETRYAYGDQLYWVEEASTDIGREADVWVRPESDVHSWSWAKKIHRSREAWVLMEDGQGPIALWTSEKEVITLVEGKFYRLDHIELRPDRRGTGLGFFVLALVACRALELDVVGLVLRCIPALRSFYETAGGEARTPKGWNVPYGEMLAFTFPEAALRSLKARADEHLDQEEDEERVRRDG